MESSSTRSGPLLVPIRREGWPFIAALAGLALFLGWFWQPLVLDRPDR